MKKGFILLIVFALIGTVSCELYDERVLPIVGIYEGQVVGVSAPFRFNVSAKSGHRLLLDAPLDGEVWDVITIDIDNKDNHRMNINIKNQSLEEGVTVKGNGFYLNGTLQLNYTLNVQGDKRNYKLVGQQW